MTVEEVKELLYSLSGAKRLVEARKRQLKQCEEFTDTLQAIDYARARIMSSNNISTVERAVLRLETCLERYQKACDKLFEIENKIEACMQYLNDNDKALVVDRFIDDTPMPILRVKYCYASQSIKNKYSKIYRKIANYSK